MEFTFKETFLLLPSDIVKLIVPFHLDVSSFLKNFVLKAYTGVTNAPIT